MDSLAFQTWLSNFGQKFPAVREWLRSLGAGDQDALLDSWERALADLDLADCLEASQRILAGEFELPGERPSQWQCIPAKIRRCTMAIIAERWAPGIVGERDEREHIRNVFARERLKAGMPREQISRELVAAGFEGIACRQEPSP